MSEPHYVYFITDNSGKSVKVPPPPRPWWDQMSFEALVAVGMFALIAAVVAGLIWIVASAQADWNRQRKHCQATGGVYIAARDYHHCLYGVREGK